MNKFLIITCIFMYTINIANAFSNSLDGSMNQNTNIKQNNQFTNNQNTLFKNNVNKPFNPKEHTGFEHQDRNFKDPSMNDTRYNSNCQFGTCTPGGLNPNNR